VFVGATGAVISTKDVLGTTSFAWRIFAVNAVLLVAAAVALALSPATVSFPIALTEGIVLAVGLIAILIVNLLLVRRSFAPLERLTRLMRSVDLLRPGQRLDVTGPQEVRELGAVFNEMLERLERERHESGWNALKTHEAERKRVAQELHDEVGQALTAVMLQIGRLAKKAPSDLADELSEALETTRSSLEDVRRIAKQLRPEALDDLGLVPALNALAAAFAERTGLRIRRRLPERLPPSPRRASPTRPATPRPRESTSASSAMGAESCSTSATTVAGSTAYTPEADSVACASAHS
jgi:two-component system sensor histidine kinase UhpB